MLCYPKAPSCYPVIANSISFSLLIKKDASREDSKSSRLWSQRSALYEQKKTGRYAILEQDCFSEFW